jgi:hypothetical protein
MKGKATTDQCSPLPSAGTLLSMARDLAFVVAIYLFFCGYVFREEYYRQFGLPTSASLSDSATFFVYSYMVFADTFHFKFAIYGLIVLILYILARFVASRWLNLRAIEYIDRMILATLVLAAFPALAKMATSAAVTEASTYKNWSSVNGLLTLGINDQLKTSASQTVAGRVFLKSIDDHEMRLFGLNDSTAYIADQKYDINNRPSNLLIYVIPRDEITHMELSLENNLK